MLFASIDIGSNAVRLLFANAYKRESTVLVEKATLVRIPVRLGKDVYKKGKISGEREKSLLKTLKAFKLLIEVYKPVDYIACATAAMRDADNGNIILERIGKETGLNIQIIDGLEEAELIKNTSRLPVKNPEDPVMFVDVGGGSTDISVVHHEKVSEVRSFKIGTIRLLEKAIKKSEWNRMNDWLNDIAAKFPNVHLVGSGGNINKIAKLFGDPFKMLLTYDQLTAAYHHLNGFSVEERMARFGMRLDRADVIVPAASIFIFVMDHLKSSSIYVPKIGVADGLIYKMFIGYNTKGIS